MHVPWQKSWELLSFSWQEKLLKHIQKVYEMAKDILILLLRLMLRYPNTTLGVFVGVVVAYLISIIPLIGWILSPIIKPACIIAGGIVGFRKDREK